MNAANLDENPAFCPKNTWKLLNNYPKQLWAKAENKFLLRRDGGVILTLFLRVSFLPQVFPAKNISMGARARACVYPAVELVGGAWLYEVLQCYAYKSVQRATVMTWKKLVFIDITPRAATLVLGDAATPVLVRTILCVYCTFSCAVLRLWVKPNRPVGQLASLS